MAAGTLGLYDHSPKMRYTVGSPRWILRFLFMHCIKERSAREEARKPKLQTQSSWHEEFAKQGPPPAEPQKLRASFQGPSNGDV